MKIKDVMEQTGLTDKAIRLYINNGLVAPSIEENYSGRKSIDFSDADVERLKNIALLRKAGFSIADIKAFLADENNINKIVDKFIDEKEKDIQRDTEIVNILKGISDEKLSFEKLCELLGETTTESDIPSEDMNISKKERILRAIFKGFGIFNIVASVGCVLANLYLIKVDCRYPYMEDKWWLAYLLAYSGFVIALALSIWLIRLCSDKREPTHRIAKMCISFILSLSVLVIAVPWSVICTVTVVAGTTVSKTEKTDNYLLFDKFVEEQTNDLFPEKIPKDAENVKYYYRYYSAFLEYKFDIFVEWKLPHWQFKDDVESELFYYEKVPVRIDEKDGTLIYELQQKQREVVVKGDWQLIYYEDSDIDREWTWGEGSYYISAFAYNEKTDTVRYIVSSSDYGEEKPYYLSLEW